MAYPMLIYIDFPLWGALCFFTVYGPWGRPDMALFKFTKAILNDEPIMLYNRGNMVRDFTYIDDAVRAVVGILDANLGQTLFKKGGPNAVAVYKLVTIRKFLLGLRPGSGTMFG
ncbi:MAG: hypothetical protein CM1200mP41_24050 [Gammaproteobacteria bacterium]|nr:MAG: hypothetical protein CM1200mP41_24050 [Gammaproteobacteria bacterium]